MTDRRTIARTFADRFGLPDEAVDALEVLLTGDDLLGDPAALPVDPDDTPELPAGLKGGRLIARGGSGEVRRVVDPQLRRTLALKTVRPDMAWSDVVLERFVDEAQATSQLQHPGVMPVHGFGTLPDGRPYFLMPEVRGRSLQDLVDDPNRSVRRLVEVLRRVCDAVGYAHERRVVHRDLKPENVMVGAHGEVLVLDWGLALVAGSSDQPAESWPTPVPGELTVDGQGRPQVATDRSVSGARLTQHGVVMGTPAYMAPEQIVEDVVTPRADVYALGGMLCAILTGTHPRAGSVALVLAEVASGKPVARPDGPPELVDLAMSCLAMAAADRPRDAMKVGEALQAWLDGDQRRAEADALWHRAEEELREAEVRHGRARALAQEARAGLGDLPEGADEDQKRPWWDRADAASRQRHEADVLELTAEQTLWATLLRAPDHLPARRLLVHRIAEAHRRAERDRDHDGALRAEVQLRAQLPELPEADARTLRAYLEGEAQVSLVTEPAGAAVTARPWVRQGRRLVLGPARDLGTTPLERVPLPQGSWQLVVAHPACHEVNYPVHLARQAHWDGVPPGADAPAPVPLPPRGSLAHDDVYVPPGWFTCGGDPAAAGAHPRRRLWCGGFVMKRFHVSCREVADFLEALVAEGRDDEVRRWGPREWHGQGVAGEPFWVPDADGRVTVGTDPDGDPWEDDWPIMMVEYEALVAYARWRSRQDGQPWRLPSELEWEKAARGVDGRFFPWGDHLEPTWCAMRSSPQVRPPSHDEYPVDTSPYGVRFLAGGASDWCLERRDAEPPEGERVRVPPLDLDVAAHVGRGGSWSAPARNCRSAARGFGTSRRGMYSQSGRLVRPWPSADPGADQQQDVGHDHRAGEGDVGQAQEDGDDR